MDLNQNDILESVEIACPKCSHSNLPEARFCSKCGNPLENTCKACGTTLTKDAAFCTSCGQSTHQPSAKPETASIICGEKLCPKVKNSLSAGSIWLIFIIPFGLLFLFAALTKPDEKTLFKSIMKKHTGQGNISDLELVLSPEKNNKHIKYNDYIFYSTITQEYNDFHHRVLVIGLLGTTF